MQSRIGITAARIGMAEMITRTEPPQTTMMIEKKKNRTITTTAEEAQESALVAIETTEAVMRIAMNEVETEIDIMTTIIKTITTETITRTSTIGITDEAIMTERVDQHHVEVMLVITEKVIMIRIRLRVHLHRLLKRLLQQLLLLLLQLQLLQRWWRRMSMITLCVVVNSYWRKKWPH